MKDVDILLVEDDEVDARAVERAFRKQKIGNPITVACDGVEALEFLRGQNGKSLPRPYIILLDLNMPRMNGIEFLKELRDDENLRTSVVFVLTTSNDDRDKTAAYEQVVAGYIVKSEAGKDFLELVQMLERFTIIVKLPGES